jgi:hypothetical protein
MYKMKKRLTVTAVIIMSAGSCGRVSDDSCFNGQINWIDDTCKVEKVTLREVELDGAFYGIPTVCDSFMIFWNYKLTKSFFNIFNLNTGEYIGDFCNKGGGPEDATVCLMHIRYIKIMERLRHYCMPQMNKSCLYGTYQNPLNCERLFLIGYSL